MSVEYFLASETECIWVASVGLGGFGFLYGEQGCMKALTGFLERNMGENLRFVSEHVIDEEIESGKLKEIDWQVK